MGSPMLRTRDLLRKSKAIGRNASRQETKATDERFVNEMEQNSKPLLEGDELQRAHDASKWTRTGYDGLIAQDGSKRLIWFQSKGRPPRYGVQLLETYREGVWYNVAASVSAAHCYKVLTEGASHKRSDRLAQACAKLADHASEYAGRRPVFWSDQIEPVQSRPRRDAERPAQRRQRRSGGKGSQRRDLATSGADVGAVEVFGPSCLKRSA